MTCNCYTEEELKELINDPDNSIEYIVICGSKAYDVTELIQYLEGISPISPDPCNFENVKQAIESQLPTVNAALGTSFQSACELVIAELDLDSNGVNDINNREIGCFVDVRQTFKYWIDALGDKCAKFNVRQILG